MLVDFGIQPAVFALCGRIVFAQPAQRGFFFRFQFGQLRQFGIDFLFAPVQFLLLDDQFGDHVAVCTADAAGVFEITRFPPRLGVFQKQDDGVVLAVFVVAVQQAGNLRFASRDFCFQPFEFVLQRLQLLPRVLLAAGDAGQFALRLFQCGTGFGQRLLRLPLRLLFLLQFRLRLVDGVADAVQIASVRRFGGGEQRQGGKQYGQYQRARGHSVKRVIKTADYSGIWRLRLFQTASSRHAARHRDGRFTI